MQFSFENLEVWQKGMDLVDAVYVLAGKYPEREKFGLTSQLTRAATSVPLNIAEGSVHGNKEFGRYLRMAQGSLVEVITNVKIGIRQRFITIEDCQNVDPLISELHFKLIGLQKTLKTKSEK